MSFRRAHLISRSFTTPFHPLKTYFYHANYLLTHSRFSMDMCYAFGSSYHNRVRAMFNHDFKLVQSAHYDVLVCSFARVYDVYCSQHVITVCKRHCKYAFSETIRQKRFQTYLPSRRRIERNKIHNQIYRKIGRTFSLWRKIAHVFSIGYFGRRYCLSVRYRRSQSPTI